MIMIVKTPGSQTYTASHCNTLQYTATDGGNDSDTIHQFRYVDRLHNGRQTGLCLVVDEQEYKLQCAAVL